MRFLSASLLLLIISQASSAQDHDHHHGGEEKIERPKVYLDKSPRIVEYQLKRLDNARLLLVETATDDKKYIPVFDAILRRPGMSRRNRDHAVAALATIRESDIATELFATLSKLSDSKDDVRVARQLSEMLLSLPAKQLQSRTADLKSATESDNGILKATGFAGLITAGQSASAWDTSRSSDSAKTAWLTAVSLLPQEARNPLRDGVVSSLADNQSAVVRKAAIRALPLIKSMPDDSFARLRPFVSDAAYRTVAVRSLLRIPDQSRSPDESAAIVKVLVDHAEATPAAKRTTDEFLDAIQLADELLRKLPPADAKKYRDRLSAVTVRVVRLHTVEEEMRYDRTFFAVEAGRPVQVILENEDLMPHNLVITRPGQLKDTALAGAALGTTPGLDGKLYVPESPDVLFATSMVNSGKREVLTFNAPDEPGEYPYVCTFPRHWMRMYGVMIVVPDLDAWQRNPVEPKDPLGNTRKFVQNWKLNDFPAEKLKDSLRGRNPLIGEKLFKDATCLGCHKIKGQGGAVGPDLEGVLKRLKGDHRSVLREILEPSYRIEPKYAVKIVIDENGRTTSGIVVKEDTKSISILVNPEVPEPKVIQKSEVEEIIPSDVSMMPKALLDKFSHDEIMEILSYITDQSE